MNGTRHIKQKGTKYSPFFVIEKKLQKLLKNN